MEIPVLINKVAQWIEEYPQFTGKELNDYITKISGISYKDAVTLQKTISCKLFQQYLPPISNLELFITESCNLKCDYCFVHGKNSFNKMNLETAKASVDLLFPKVNRAKKAQILFIGGEPMLEFTLIKEVVEYADAKAKQCEMELTYDMTTNGMLFDEKKLSIMREHKIKFLLSIDGLPGCHDVHRKTGGGRGSFQMIADIIPLMIKYQPWLGARVTPMPDTVDRLAEGVVYLHELGINQYIIGVASGGIDWDEESLNEYENQLILIAQYLRKQKEKKDPIRISIFEKDESCASKFKDVWGCRAGNTSLTVAPSGKIFPCTKLQGQNNLKGVYQLGSVQNRITYLERRKRLTNFIPPKRNKCRTCDIQDDCNGGCYAINYETTGSIYNPCPTQCRIIRKLQDIQKKGLEILGEYA